MIPQTRKYFVVTVHYGSPEVTDTLLESINKNTSPPTQIIVIDHAVTPYTPKVGATVLRPKENSGYGGGMNVALGRLYGAGLEADDVLILLNNDVQLSQDAMSVIKKWFQEKERNGLYGAIPATLNLMTGRTTVNQVPKWPWETAYIDGSLLALTVQTLFAVKGMPDHLFMYWEDVEMSHRIVSSGRPISCIPNLKISHPLDTSDGWPDKVYYLVRNGAWYLSQQTPLMWRVYWKLINSARLYLHSHGTRKDIVVSALRDAREGSLGKKEL